ncbi:MAG: hypothetical protein KDA88_14560 [Planctomycetaceae bacterium]|nr:hypothetical protein [Planctomycetaceae bacterium]MCB9950810.1 hypothetical protein [Planctomycetaceae bacterium]
MEEFIAAVLVFVSIIGWIIKLTRQSEMNQRRHDRERRRGRRGNEVDDFMDESNRGRSSRSDFIEDDDIVVVSQPKRRPPRRSPRSRDEVWREQSGRSEQPTQQPAPRKPVTAPPKRESLADRHIESSVGAHVRDAMSPHLSQHVAQDLPHFVDNAVKKDLGVSTSGARARRETTGRPMTAADTVRALLKSRKGVRQAILISEVLSPPLALRSKKQ